MKINTRLRLAVFIPLMMALVVVITLALSYRDLQHTQDNGEKVRQIRSGITELNQIVFSYILFHEERPREQFVEEQNTLTGLISSVHLQNPDRQSLLDALNNENKTIEAYFAQLVSLHQSGNPTPGAEDSVVGLLLSGSYDADSDAALLRGALDDDIRNAEIRTDGLILLVLVLSAASSSVLLFRTLRTITHSLSDLVHGTQVIGSGNLGYVIPETSQDEIGDLTRAFNSMTANLKAITASKTELQKEVAERTKTEEALRESEARFRSVLQDSRDVIYRVNLRTNLYEYVSPSVEELMLYTPEEFLGMDGKTAMAMIHPDDLPAMQQALLVLEHTGQAEAEYRQRSKIGEYRWFSNSMTLIKDQTGQPLYRSGNIRDITERKHAELELKRKNIELEIANKELESFSYSVSHDLRAPLRTMDGYSKALLEDYSDRLDAQAKRWLENIRSSSQFMGQLINDILGLSRVVRTELKFENLNLSDIALSVAGNTKDIAPDRQVQFSIIPGIGAVGDRNLLTMVLQNLFENAFKFTSGRENARIEFGTFQADGSTVYFVKDNGVGFDMKYVDKLFRPFQRLHSSREYSGTGIGLVTVQRIIQRHRGRIWTQGEINKGATFYFTLWQEET